MRDSRNCIADQMLAATNATPIAAINPYTASLRLVLEDMFFSFRVARRLSHTLLACFLLHALSTGNLAFAAKDAPPANWLTAVLRLLLKKK
jgi:hypothetical protein